MANLSKGMAISLAVVAIAGCRSQPHGGGARAPLSDETKPPKLEDLLLEVKLGSTTKDLQQRFPTLYRHQLAMGEVLYEACDQKNLVVFSLVAEPWSPEFVTSVMVHQEHDVGVCRDATGGLPDLGFAAATARTVRIGDPAAVVVAKYGKPDEEQQLPEGDQVVRFRSSGKGYEPPIQNILLVFRLHDGKVLSFTIAGDIPGAKTPFSQ